MTVMPINFVRFGDDALTPAGTYIHLGELLVWLAENEHEDFEDLVLDLATMESAPASASGEVFAHETLCGPSGATNSQPHDGETT